MIQELQAVWKQFEETYAAIRESLAIIPDDKLVWQAGPNSSSASVIVRHIGRANLVYCHEIERTERDLGDPNQQQTREQLQSLLDRSETRVRDVFSAASVEDTREPRADDWAPLGKNIDGPFDAIWFAHQMVRHSAYHLGQLNYLIQLGGFESADTGQ